MKMIKLSLFFYLILLSLPNSADILLKNPQVSESVYKYYLERNPEAKSFILSLLDKENSNLEKEMFNDYKNAKKSLFLNKLNSAKYFFTNITSKTHQKDWRKHIRKIIFSSYIHLAELNPVKIKLYLSQALHFDLDESLEGLIQNKLTQKKYYKIKSKRLLINWRIPQLFKNKHIFINGCSIKKKSISLPNSKIRISIFSNDHLPFSRIIHAKDVNTKKIHLQPILNLNENIKNKFTSMGVEENLIYINKDQKISNFSVNIKEINIEKNKLVNLTPPIILKNKTNKTDTFFKRYLGFGLFAISALLIKKYGEKNKQTTIPSLSFGF